MKKRYSSFDPFTDLLFNILLGFTFLFFITMLFINPITKLGNVNMKAEYIITVDWKDSLPDDIDLWVKDPNGEIVSYLKKDAGWLHLDRDDRGVVNDKIIIDGKELQPKNAFVPIVVTDSGIIIDCKESQLKNADSLIVIKSVLYVCMSADIKLEQSLKQLAPIVVTNEPNVTYNRFCGNGIP